MNPAVRPLPGSVLAAIAFSGYAHAELDRPYTLRSPVPHALELGREEMVAEGRPMSFASAVSDSPTAALPPARFAWGSTDGAESIELVPMAGEEFRAERRSDAVWATESGALIRGRKGIASFRLDARLFMEAGGPRNRSFDREGRDFQDESATGSISYGSYARYRGGFRLDTRVGRLEASRDAVHWGPGIFNNLVFNQDAVPFHQLAYHAGIGPLRVTTLYGDLIAGNNEAYSEANLEGKNLYAHRYEVALGSDWLLGLSEQLILYGQNRPYLFAPIFPLFIAKGFMYEESNNGNLAVDAAFRAGRSALIYAEFLLDDLESPSSLFTKDYSQNKWGFMAGAHYIRDGRRWGTCGFIAEYARLEPWTYGHFTPNTAQASHVGYPLGNPLGPNSQNVTLKVYLRMRTGAYFGLTQVLRWKGADPGSDLNDSAPLESKTHKAFLVGAEVPDYLAQPETSWFWNGFSFDLSAMLGARLEARIGLRYFL